MPISQHVLTCISEVMVCVFLVFLLLKFLDQELSKLDDDDLVSIQ